MILLGIHLSFLAYLVVGVLTVIWLLKLYAFVNCGYFHGREQMNGKTVIITGTTGGIGKETTKELARKGARIIMACRNVDVAKKLRDEIVGITKNENIVVKKLDISSQKSIREFAEDIIRTETKLDVLIHNAATCEKKFQKNEDGVELTMATNHYGPFLLTHLLIDLLKRSAPSRVVVVSSVFHRLSWLNLDRINLQVPGFLKLYTAPPNMPTYVSLSNSPVD
ncbi:hypothetical protein JTB14_010278 [Gonioctena quinquepunctata]|nr:hypothetical protein JTB14_010278 [Gonioctena quinquepunctata]